MGDRNVLVAYFSRSGENFNVGVVDRGSGEILADMISLQLGASSYGIIPEKSYPEDLAECNKVAKAELMENARPSLRDPLPEMDGITDLVLVYPNWWGNLPMAVYTFLDGIGTDGLSIYPVCTHEDNGLAMTDRILTKAYPGARIMKGIAIRGSEVQADREGTEKEIRKYLSASGLSL